MRRFGCRPCLFMLSLVKFYPILPLNKTPWARVPVTQTHFYRGHLSLVSFCLMITVSLVLKHMIQAFWQIVHDGLYIFHHPSPCTLLICFPSQRPLQGALGHWVWVLQTLPSRLELHVHSWLRISYWVHGFVREPGRACVWHSTSEAVCRCSLATTQASFSDCLISMHHVNAQIRPLVALVIGKNKLTLGTSICKRMTIYLPLSLNSKWS